MSSDIVVKNEPQAEAENVMDVSLPPLPFPLVPPTYRDAENESTVSQTVHSSMMADSSEARVERDEQHAPNVNNIVSHLYTFGLGQQPPTNQLAPNIPLVNPKQTLNDLMNSEDAVYVVCSRPQSFQDALVSLQIKTKDKNKNSPSEEVCLIFSDGGLRLRLISRVSSLIDVQAMVKRSSFDFFSMPTSPNRPVSAVSITVKLADLIVASRAMDSTQSKLEFGLHSYGGPLKIRNSNLYPTLYASMRSSSKELMLGCLESSLAPLVNRDVDVDMESLLTSKTNYLLQAQLLGRIFVPSQVLFSAFSELGSVTACDSVVIAVHQDPFEVEQNESIRPLINMKAVEANRVRHSIQFPVSTRDPFEFVDLLVQEKRQTLSQEDFSLWVENFMIEYNKNPFAFPTPGEKFKQSITEHKVLQNFEFCYPRHNIFSCATSISLSRAPIELLFYSSGVCRIVVNVNSASEFDSTQYSNANINKEWGNNRAVTQNSDNNWVEYILAASE